MSDLLKTDEELEAMQTETVEVAEPELNEDLDIGFELEIVDPAEYGNSKPQALIEAEQKLMALEEEKKRLSDASDQSAALQTTMASVQAMQEQLAKGIQVNAPTAPVEAFDFEAHQKKLNEGIYTDAGKSVTAFMEPILMNLNTKIDAASEVATLAGSKSEMLLEDSSRSMYLKYKDEIEGYAKQVKGSGAYQQAINQAKLAHIDDIIAEKVAAAQATPSPKAPIMTNVGGQSAPAGPRKAAITPGMRAWMTNLMTHKLVSESYALERAKEEKAAGRIPN